MPGALPDESWILAQGEHEGKPLLLRFNEGAPPPDERVAAAPDRRRSPPARA